MKFLYFLIFIFFISCKNEKKDNYVEIITNGNDTTVINIYNNNFQLEKIVFFGLYDITVQHYDTQKQILIKEIEFDKSLKDTLNFKEFKVVKDSIISDQNNYAVIKLNSVGKVDSIISYFENEIIYYEIRRYDIKNRLLKIESYDIDSIDIFEINFEYNNYSQLPSKSLYKLISNEKRIGKTLNQINKNGFVEESIFILNNFNEVDSTLRKHYWTNLESLPKNIDDLLN